jgi:chemotaxis protein CheX
MEIADKKICQITESVWTSVLGLGVRRAAAPFAPSRSMLGCVHITGAWQGAVTLESTPQLARRAASILLGVDEQGVTPEEVRDAMGELTNIIGGNLKGLLPDPSQLSVPAVVEGHEVTLQVQGTHPVSEVTFDCDGQLMRVTLLRRDELMG